MGRFDEAVAIVTGGASGIGLGIATRFQRDGATTVIIDLHDAEKSAKEIGAVAYTADVSDPGAMEAVLDQIVERHGGVHHLVNNAGIDGPVAPIAEFPLEEFGRVVDVNIRGVFVGMRLGIPRITASGGGSITNIASAGGVKSVPGLGLYCATKAAVISMTRTAAVECGTNGVRINVVLPGAIETPLLEQVMADSPQIREQIESEHPVGRMGSPAELANVVTFLASEEAGFVTGAVVAADGGFTAV